MARLLQKDEWVVYAAFLPALLASGAIGAISALAWRAQTPWHFSADNAVCAEDEDYVEQLAKRGIAKLPGYESPEDERSTPSAAVVAAQLRARNAC
jgi:hypothetical protein